MIELILILGLLFVLFLAVLLHFEEIIQAQKEYPECANFTTLLFDPWFMSVEIVLLMSIVYIFRCWIS